MENDLQEQWLRFINGHWTKEKPTKPGVYPHSPRDSDQMYKRGNQTPVHLTHLLRHQDWGILYQVVNFSTQKDPIPYKGWWWSEPMPLLPTPGPWGPQDPNEE